LPVKFNIDKRIGHLSDLIRSGQVDRENALIDLKKEIYDPILFNQDKEFVLKKLNYSNIEFEKMMLLPIRSFRDYPNSYSKIVNLKKIVNWLRFKGFYSK